MPRAVRTTLIMTSIIAVAFTARADEPKSPVRPGEFSANAPRRAGEHRSEWEIVFPDDITTEEYARQIDYFKIEIAAVAKNGKIDYISEVTRPKPKRHAGHESTDYRLRIGWKKGNLHAADRRLLGKAGVNSDNKALWHYFPIQAQSQLADLEKAYAGRDANDNIVRTRFEIRPREKDDDAYEFVVIEQDPPKPTEAATTSENQPRSAGGKSAGDGKPEGGAAGKASGKPSAGAKKP